MHGSMYFVSICTLPCYVKCTNLMRRSNCFYVPISHAIQLTSASASYEYGFYVKGHKGIMRRESRTVMISLLNWWLKAEIWITGTCPRTTFYNNHISLVTKSIKEQGWPFWLRCYWWDLAFRFIKTIVRLSRKSLVSFAVWACVTRF